MKPVRALGVALLALAVIVSPRVLTAQDKTARGTVITMTGDSLTVKGGPNDLRFGLDPKTTPVAPGAGTPAARSRNG